MYCILHCASSFAALKMALKLTVLLALLANAVNMARAQTSASYCVGLDVDGVADEWDSCASPELTMSMTQVGSIVPEAAVGTKTNALRIRVAHDGTNIYVLAKVTGDYYLNLTAGDDANKLSHSASVMWRIGERATMLDMGGCRVNPPGASTYNCTAVDDFCAQNADACNVDCEPYLVDVWHIETGSPGSIPGVQYPYRGPIAFPDGSNYLEFAYRPEGEGEYQMAVERLTSGNDHTSNSDDEFSVHPCIRGDDGELFVKDGTPYRNQIRFAWSHSAISTYKYPFAEIGSSGEYTYEFSRPLTTNENTDAQFTVGGDAEFAFAFWTPTAPDEGWENVNHFVAPPGFTFSTVTLNAADNVSDDDDGAAGDDDDSAAAMVMSTALTLLTSLVAALFV